MLALVWGAVRTRRAQVLTVLILTALAAAVAAAGPWFAIAGGARAAAADVDAAAAADRSLSIRKIIETGGDPAGTVDQFAANARGLLPLPATDPVSGLVLPLITVHGGQTPSMAIAYREDMCDHLRLDGPCPAAPGEAAISVNTAQQLGLGRGDRLGLRRQPDAAPLTLRVVATYSLDDPAGAYWSNPLFVASGGLDPAFTTIGTFTDEELGDPTISYDVQVPDRLIRGDDGYDLAGVLRKADYDLGRQGLRLVNTTGSLLRTIARDREAIREGVLVAVIQVLVLAWFAIGLAGQYTGRDRRGDAALLKLRGSSRGAMLRLAWGQHLVPLVLGALAGLPLGYLLARLLAGPVGRPQQQQTALTLSVAATVAVLVGGLAVLALIEAVALRRPVSDLLREVTGGRGDWRSGLADLLLLAVAVSAIYQARAGAAGTGLALAAPALVALAVALLLARLLGRVADRGGGAAVRTGHLRLGLTAVQVSRQPGGDRVFALVVVAVAVFATAVGGYAGEHTARVQRSGAELGAARVLTVQAPNRTALLAAVRAADPAGDQAMAVTVDRTSEPPVLAVDSGRLAAVAHWRPEYGPIGALPATVAPAPLPRITGGRLAVRVSRQGAAPVQLNLVLQHEGTGAPVPVRFGPVGAGERTLEAPVAGCAAAPGCRILRWELTGPSAVSVRGLDQLDPPGVILDPARLADVARWRSGTAGAALDLAAAGGTLTLSADATAGRGERGTTAYAVDTDLPLPVVLAGAAPPSWQFGEPALLSLGSEPAPVRVVRTVTALPVVGRSGVLADLDATRRVIGDATPAGEFQVWLAPGAPPGIVGALTRAGLTIAADETIGDWAAHLAGQAPAVVTRFSLVAGVVVLLLAAAALGVAGAVDRRSRLEQLRALRVQGLPGRVAVLTAYAGIAALVLSGLVAGLAAAALARPLVRITLPAFTDGWDVLPAPGALGLASLALAGLVALLVLGLTGWLAVLPLTHRLRREAGIRGRAGHGKASSRRPTHHGKAGSRGPARHREAGR
ncbi:FtsX-like permease family protein [Actinoplanes sp. NPDC051513]|uniref:FtsX-like permease family protein n=1 Tax=Actinoplanes sp. NPDC051513 TaxID=3363908 RepID=UPI0037A75BED